jgi:hypothetical protein
MSSFTLLRKLFSLQTKSSRFEENCGGEGKLTKQRSATEEVAGRRNTGAFSRVPMNKCWIFAFSEMNEFLYLLIH